jgi:hypothetical protein
VGFNRPNDLGMPCAGCLGFSADTVWVEPNQFVSSGSTGLYYTVLQEDGWSGNLSVTFALTGAGVLIQDMIVTGTLTKGQGLLVLSGSAVIPQTTYSGAATLTVTTTATPADGSSPFILKSFALMQVGTTGIRRVVQVFAGLNAPNESEFPCTSCGPPGAVGVQPYQFPQPGAGAAEYVVFQTDGWDGGVDSTMDLVDRGKIVESQSLGASIADRGPFLTMISVGTFPAGNGYTGPATLVVTTTATSRRGSGQPVTFRSFSPLYIQ